MALNTIYHFWMYRQLFFLCYFERFSTSINKITSSTGSEEDAFAKPKQKNHSKTQLDERKNWLFMMIIIISFFSISPLLVRRYLSYIIKDEVDSSEGLYKSWANEGFFHISFVVPWSFYEGLSMTCETVLTELFHLHKFQETSV